MLGALLAIILYQSFRTPLRAPLQPCAASTADRSTDRDSRWRKGRCRRVTEACGASRRLRVREGAGARALQIGPCPARLDSLDCGSLSLRHQSHPELFEQVSIAIRFRIWGRQKFFSHEDRVRTGKKAQ